MAISNPIRYKSLLGWSTNSAALPAGVQTTYNWTISERGISGRYVAGAMLGALQGAFTALQHNNVNLTTGFCPLSVLSDQSCINPRTRRFVEVNDIMSIDLVSTAGAGSASVALTTAPVPGLPDYYEGDAYRGSGVRNLVCYGGTNIQTIAPGATANFQLAIDQAGQAGYVCVGCASDPTLTGLEVVALTYDNISLTDGQSIPAALFAANNDDSPLLGAFFETNHLFTMSIINNSAVAAVDVAIGVTAG